MYIYHSGPKENVIILFSFCGGLEKWGFHRDIYKSRLDFYLRLFTFLDQLYTYSSRFDYFPYLSLSLCLCVCVFLLLVGVRIHGAGAFFVGVGVGLGLYFFFLVGGLVGGGGGRNERV